MSSALETALAKLRVRDRFELEIRGHLAAFDAEEVETAIARLRQQGILNDRRTAESYVAAHPERGAERLRQELLAKGCPEEIADAALPEDELANALAALAKKFRPDTDRARAGRFLFARGFAEETVESALDRFLSS